MNIPIILAWHTVGRIIFHLSFVIVFNYYLLNQWGIVFCYQLNEKEVKYFANIVLLLKNNYCPDLITSLFLSLPAILFRSKFQSVRPSVILIDNAIIDCFVITIIIDILIQQPQE